jgi:hypothetical protein
VRQFTFRKAGDEEHPAAAPNEKKRRSKQGGKKRRSTNDYGDPGEKENLNAITHDDSGGA